MEKSAMPEIHNEFMVGVQGPCIVVMNPPRGVMTKKQALAYAAWLVTLADDDGEFPEFLRAVQS
jgi:hypothetical protein